MKTSRTGRRPALHPRKSVYAWKPVGARRFTAQRRNGSAPLDSTVVALTFLFLFTVCAYQLFGTGRAVEAGELAQADRTGGSVPVALRPVTQPVRIAVDSRPLTGDAEDPFAVCSLPDSLGADRPPWESWASLRGTRLAATSSVSSVPVYASRFAAGLTALVSNNTEESCSLEVTAKLGRGVYTVERAVFDAKSPETPGRIERFESLVLGDAAKATKRGSLAPGSLAVYRFINRSLDVQQAYDETRSAVRSASGESPAACRTIMVPLRECEAHLGSLAKGIKPEKRYDSLRYIHRALMTANHAQALAQNCAGRGSLSKQSASRIDAAILRLQTALTDLSAGCLNLLPGIFIGRAEDSDPALHKVTVQLANGGSQSVSLVRLGAEAPVGSAVTPSDRAMFDVLRPGETARATFTVRLPNDSPPSELSAEFAWTTARSPAHMRLKGSL